MKRRGRTEILTTIREVANGKTTQTKNMYSAFLGYNQLKDCPTILIKNNLIVNRKGTQIYKTTKKGLHFLKSIVK